jgi:hypothetical protein
MNPIEQLDNLIASTKRKSTTIFDFETYREYCAARRGFHVIPEELFDNLKADVVPGDQ